MSSSDWRNYHELLKAHPSKIDFPSKLILDLEASNEFGDDKISFVTSVGHLSPFSPDVMG